MILKLQRAIECLLLTCLLCSCSKHGDNTNPTPNGKIKKSTLLQTSNSTGNYYYNKDLQLSEHKWVSTKGTVDTHFGYIYSNKKIKEVNMSPYNNGAALEIVFKQQYFYNNDKLAEMQEKDMRTGKVTDKYLFASNDKLQFTNCSRINMNPIPNVTSYMLYDEYEYDSSGNLITVTSKTRFTSDDKLQLASRIEYSYDNKKNPYQGLPLYLPHDMHLYLSPNNVIREVMYEPNGKRFLENRYEYEYDIEGKPVKITKILLFANGNETNVAMPVSIEYY